MTSEEIDAIGVTVDPPGEGRRATDKPGARIVGVDLARGIALLGMAATHMLAVRDQETGHLTTIGWLFAGRASSLFALLAGVSLALVTGGPIPRRGRARARASTAIAVRAVIIGGIGLWLAGVGTPVAVILAYYALLFALTLPFLGLSSRTLFALAASWAVVSPILSHVWRQDLGGGPNTQVDFAALGDDPLAAFRELMVLGYYPVLTWMTYLLAGVAIGRLDLRRASTAIRLGLTGLGLAVGAWVGAALLLAGGYAARIPPAPRITAGASWWDYVSFEGYGTTPTDGWAWLVVAAPHTGTPLDLIGTTGSAMAVLAGCLLLTRVKVVRTLLWPVAAAGSMTLTLYTVHVLALAQPWGSWDSVSYYLTHVAVALVFATVWLRFLRRGPLEGLVHTVSNGVAVASFPERVRPRPTQRT